GRWFCKSAESRQGRMKLQVFSRPWRDSVFLRSYTRHLHSRPAVRVAGTLHTGLFSRAPDGAAATA
ncbi:MAG: hypothetical protein ACRD4I_10145, partial [Candidatus Angelobacter sp.]